jgi:hypothetical protein
MEPLPLQTELASNAAGRGTARLIGPTPPQIDDPDQLAQDVSGQRNVAANGNIAGADHTTANSSAPIGLKCMLQSWMSLVHPPTRPGFSRDDEDRASDPQFVSNLVAQLDAVDQEI